MRTARARELPQALCQLYPFSGNWHRVWDWGHSVIARDCYQTAYYCVTFDKQGNSTEHKVAVVVHRRVFCDARAAMWEINRQLAAGLRAKRKAEQRKVSA